MHRFFSILCLSLISIGTAQACSCIGPAPCRPIKPNDVVFLGKVTARDNVGETVEIDGRILGHRTTYVFHITAIENFVGDQNAGQDMLIHTGSGGGDCGYPFHVGETYLVDAYRSKGTLSTGICAITSPAVMSTPVVRQFRALAAGSRLPDLTGLVGVQAGNSFDDLTKFRPLSGIPITVTAVADGTPAKTTTDSDGVYTLATLSPGKYTVEAKLPPNLSTWQLEINKKPLQIEVPDVKGTGAACRQDLMVLPSGSISGRVLDPEGKPVAGFISAHSTDPTKNRNVSWAAAGDTNPDGTFTLHFLSEGAYRIEFTTHEDFRKTWFYPGTTQKTNADSISLKDGQHLQDVRFVIGPDAPK
jgi:hypothetical protein